MILVDYWKRGRVNSLKKLKIKFTLSNYLLNNIYSYHN